MRDDALAEGGRFETTLRTIGFVTGPIIAAVVFLLHPGDLPYQARTLLAILALAVVFWMTEAIPLPATGLLSSSLAIVLGVAPARAVFQPYADPVIFLFVGSFLLAEAFRKYGLDRRVADLVVGGGRRRTGPTQRVVGVGGATAFISCWLSNTATAALMTPMALGIAEVPGAGAGAPGGPDALAGRGEVPSRATTAMLIMVAYAASIGGMATLVGTPPNLLTAGFIERLCGVKVGFAAWLLFGLPIAAVLMVLATAWIWFLFLRRRPRVPHEAAAPIIGDVGVPDGEAGRGARYTIGAFVLAGILWMLPAVVSAIWGADAPAARLLLDVLPESAVALGAAALLFVAPVSWRRRRFALTWAEGRRVDWGIILLFGGGLSLGTLAETTGVARFVGERLGSLGLARSESGFLLCAIVLTIVVSEFASNTASATLLVPMVVATAKAIGFDPVRPALAVGLAATCGFMFPVSSPPNAIVFSTGRVPLRDMIFTGIVFDLVAAVVIWAGMLWLGPVLPR
jgi:solute carrier family 13 (sodium-dependent dicarboxylate transporter), member 2/3/5